jgi:hypothetical protein
METYSAHDLIAAPLTSADDYAPMPAWAEYATADRHLADPALASRWAYEQRARQARQAARVVPTPPPCAKCSQRITEQTGYVFAPTREGAVWLCADCGCAISAEADDLAAERAAA